MVALQIDEQYFQNANDHMQNAKNSQIEKSEVMIK